MSKQYKQLLHVLIIGILAIIFSGCAGSVTNMQVVKPQDIVTSPKSGKSMVVFMRPSSFGFAIQSSVFEIKDKQPTLVGIVAAKKKLAYELEPGKHLFMVVGENADFMHADLEENKTYYALVTPRMGFWKARFSLKPVHQSEIASGEFNTWYQDASEWVKTNNDSNTWFLSNKESVYAKYTDYYADWMQNTIKVTLNKNDGK